MITRALDASTWPDFAALVERHNGVWGGCWCMGFHPEGVGRHKTPEQNRGEKEARVREGRAHAALVYDGAACVGWCQFGSPDELPRIKHKRAYLAQARPTPPDWRITCFFVDKDHRRQGVVVRRARRRAGADRRARRRRSRATPEEIGERGKVSAGFLHNGALAMFERHGFERVRQLGKHHWLVTRHGVEKPRNEPPAVTVYPDMRPSRLPRVERADEVLEAAPAPPAPASLLSLQQAAGNVAVQRLLQRRTRKPAAKPPLSLVQDGAGALHSVDAAGATQLVGTREPGGGRRPGEKAVGLGAAVIGHVRPGPGVADAHDRAGARGDGRGRRRSGRRRRPG